MIPTIALTGTRIYPAIVQFLTSPGKGLARLASFNKRTPVDALLQWFRSASVFAVVHSITSASDDPRRARFTEIEFMPSRQHQSHFALLRGLLEFSRPKGIDLRTNTQDRSFTVRLSDNDASIITNYLANVQERFNAELVFKASLKKVLRFEGAVKTREATLYRELMACA